LSTFPDGLYQYGGQPVTSVNEARAGGDTFWVWSNGNDGYTGRTPDAAFRTLARAVHVAEEYDTILIRASHWPYVSVSAPGQYAYLETDIPINITQQGLKIVGQQTTPLMLGSPTLHAHNTYNLINHPDGAHMGTLTEPLITINANNVEISNLTIQMQIAEKGILIANTNYVSRVYIHDVAFNGASSNGTYGLYLTTVPESLGVVVERCFFVDWLTAAIVFTSGQGSAVKDCIFIIPDSSTGIILSNTGKPNGTFILNNRLIAQGSSSYGITYAAGGVGDVMIDGNHSCGFTGVQDYPTYAASYFGANYRNGALVTA